MTLIYLNEFTEDFFNKSKEEQEEHIENFYEIFSEMSEDETTDKRILLIHLDRIIERAEQNEMFEISHIFLNVKNKLINKLNGL